MATKDITDEMVCLAYHYAPTNVIYKLPHSLLVWKTGEHPKVCWRAMERACNRQLIEFGTSLNYGWLTPAGKALIAHEVARLTRLDRYRSGYARDADPVTPDFGVGDTIRVTHPYRHMKLGDTFTCLNIDKDGWVAINDGHCIENDRFVDGMWWKRFEKVVA